MFCSEVTQLADTTIMCDNVPGELFDAPLELRMMLRWRLVASRYGHLGGSTCN